MPKTLSDDKRMRANLYLCCTLILALTLSAIAMPFLEIVKDIHAKFPHNPMLHFMIWVTGELVVAALFRYKLTKQQIWNPWKLLMLNGFITLIILIQNAVAPLFARVCCLLVVLFWIFFELFTYKWLYSDCVSKFIYHDKMARVLSSPACSRYLSLIVWLLFVIYLESGRFLFS